jgi:CHAT domain
MIEVTLQPTELFVGEAADLVVQLTNTSPGTCAHIIFVLTLPSEIMLLRGQDEIVVRRLEPGRTETRTLLVRAIRAARCRFTSTNFSYRDRYGMTCRRDGDFQAELVATVPERRGPEPEAQPRAPKVAFTVDLVTAELPYGEWALLAGRITNSGDTELGNVVLSISGPVAPGKRGRRARIGSVSPASSASFEFFVCADGAAGSVPVYFDLSFDDRGRSCTRTLARAVQVTKENHPSPSAQKEPVVLFFAANPADIDALRTGKEFMVIERALESGHGQARIKIRPSLATRAKDISRELLRVKPWIVHFAGHGGGPEESFAAEDEDGYARVVPPGGLASLFGIAGKGVECVIINACSTVGLAQALSQHVDYVIAMSQPIYDWDAIEFSRAFYQALAADYSIRSAFDLGLAELEMLSDGAAYEIPKFLGRLG